MTVPDGLWQTTCKRKCGMNRGICGVASEWTCSPKMLDLVRCYTWSCHRLPRGVLRAPMTGRGVMRLSALCPLPYVSHASFTSCHMCDMNHSRHISARHYQPSVPHSCHATISPLSLAKFHVCLCVCVRMCVCVCVCVRARVRASLDECERGKMRRQCTAVLLWQH